jgi:hypothetical protein
MMLTVGDINTPQRQLVANENPKRTYWNVHSNPDLVFEELLADMHIVPTWERVREEGCWCVITLRFVGAVRPWARDGTMTSITRPGISLESPPPPDLGWTGVGKGS